MHCSKGLRSVAFGGALGDEANMPSAICHGRRNSQILIGARVENLRICGRDQEGSGRENIAGASFTIGNGFNVNVTLVDLSIQFPIGRSSRFSFGFRLRE